jgi:predicted acylesterase/phospholipase RssA
MRRIALSLLAVLGTAFVASAEDQKVPFRKCKALVMSGGANKGAYEAGVAHGLSRLLNGTDAHYDVVSGVSAGALNSAAMAYWAPD